MNKYLNAACPVCRKLFGPDDDIVVCPDCGAPHHRSCYQQVGHCALADNHRLGKNWEPPAPPPEEVSEADSTEVSCPRCGAKNPEDGLFCNSCGARLHQGVQGGQDGPASWQHWGGGVNPGINYGDIYGGASPDEELDGIKVRDLARFVGNNSSYFMTHFIRMKQSQRPISLNLSALFFGWQYFLFRKMYLLALLILGVESLLSLPAAICLYQDLAVTYGILADYPVWFEGMLFLGQILSVFSTAGSMALCLFCNKLYYRHCIRKIKKIQQKAYISQQEYGEALARKGQINMIAVALLIIVYVTAIMIMMPMFMV